jgi:hypothetical protein
MTPAAKMLVAKMLVEMAAPIVNRMAILPRRKLAACRCTRSGRAAKPGGDAPGQRAGTIGVRNPVKKVSGMRFRRGDNGWIKTGQNDYCCPD